MPQLDPRVNLTPFSPQLQTTTLLNMTDAINQFVKKQISLLNLEKEAEIEENERLKSSYSEIELERRGICLRRLAISSCKSGLGGRTLVKLETRNKQELPAHKFSCGDIVAIIPSNAFNKSKQGEKGELVAPNYAQGVVHKAASQHVTVACEDIPEQLVDTTSFLSLHKLSNEVTYKKLGHVLTTLPVYHGPANRLLDILFGDLQPRLDNDFMDRFTLKPYNPFLNSSQLEAIKFAISAPDIALIHGPPGTGKTTTVVELIQQLKMLNLKILACAPSNVAVDNIVEKLSGKSGHIPCVVDQLGIESPLKIRMVRVGHPARLLPTILKYSLDIEINASDNQSIVKDVRKDINALLSQLPKQGKESRNRIRGEIRELRKELATRESQTINDIVNACDVVLATNVGADQKFFKDKQFDVVIIDEAAQALEASCYIPLLKGTKLILAGDNCQLPPTVKSTEAEAQGLGETLFDRITRMHGDSVTRMLTTQYRMNEFIMKWPSMELYANKLEAHQSVKSHLLCHIPSVMSTPNTCIPLLLIDTARCNLYELDQTEGESKENTGEANIVLTHLQSLVRAGLSPSQIGIITPYNGQVNLIKRRLSELQLNYDGLEIGSVDGFQGREKEAIIISFVRSNTRREVGFLSENRRTNVAMTRARRHLAIVSDTETISSNPFLERLVKYMRSNGEIRDATEYLDGSCNMYNEEVDMRDYDSKQTVTDITSEPRERKKDESEQKVRKKLERQIVRLLQSPHQKSYTFPSTLTAHERMIVHELAEEFSLEHVSSGTGSERSISVAKKNFVPPDTQPESVSREVNVEIHPEIDHEDNVDDHVEGTEEIGVQDKEINELEGNEELHEVQERSQGSVTNKASRSTKHKKKTKKPKRPQAPVISATPVDLDTAIQMNRRCHIDSCREPVHQFGRSCEFCRALFCTTHIFPESHGCGAAARQKARSEWLGGTGYAAVTGQVKPKPKPQDRNVLQQQLKKKIDSISKQRKPQPKK